MVYFVNGEREGKGRVEGDNVENDSATETKGITGIYGQADDEKGEYRNRYTLYDLGHTRYLSEPASPLLNPHEKSIISPA